LYLFSNYNIMKIILILIVLFIIFVFFYLKLKENLIVDKNADTNGELSSNCLYNNYSDCNANDLCEWLHSKCFVRLGTNYIY